MNIAVKHEGLAVDSVKLSKGQRNTYGWEIKVYGEGLTAIIERLKAADTQLRKAFPVEESGGK